MLAFTHAMLLAVMAVPSGTAPPPATAPSVAATMQANPAAAATPTAHDNPENDVVVTAPRRPPPGDPFQAVNAQSFAVTEAVDRNLIGPVSLAYKRSVPSPIRSGIHNFLYNVREPIVFVNFMLQRKFGKAAETLARFTLNSTVGVGGVMDIARRKPFHLPRRGNGFADTLGFYGVPNGPFMFLPIVGPTTVRDLFGGFVDRAILPVGVGTPFTSSFYGGSAGVLGALDHRADFDAELHILHDNVPSPYAASRDFYLQRRQAEIDFLKGRRSDAASPVSENPLGYIAPAKVAPPPVVPQLAPAALPATDQPASPVPPATNP